MKRYVWCALLLAAPLLAAADDEVGHWYFDPQIGVIGTDGLRHTNDGFLYGVGFGNNLSEQWSAELNLNGTQKLSDSRDAGNLTLYGGSLDILRVFERPARVAPYISLGIGAVRDSASVASTASLQSSREHSHRKRTILSGSPGHWPRSIACSPGSARTRR